MSSTDYPTRYHAVGLHNVADVPYWDRLDADVREAVDVVGRVLPFRTNRYVVDHLIDWSRVPEDPIFQLVFPQRPMLDPAEFDEIRRLLRREVPVAEVAAAVNRIRLGLNPHPAGQLTHNVPELDDRPLQGIQHKYRETVLFFPFSRADLPCLLHLLLPLGAVRRPGRPEIRGCRAGRPRLVPEPGFPIWL